MKSLQNKNIIITGGGEGIGAEASKLLASEGANIILTCKTKEEGFFVEKEIIDNGGSAKYIEHDVTSESDWKMLLIRQVQNLDISTVLLIMQEALFHSPWRVLLLKNSEM